LQALNEFTWPEFEHAAPSTYQECTPKELADFLAKVQAELVPPPAPVAAEAARAASSPPESAPGPDQAPPVGAPGADPTPAAHGGTPAVATAPAGGSLRPAGGGSGLPQGEPDGLPHPPGTRPAPIPDAPGASGASPARPTTGGLRAGRPAAAGGASPRRPATSESDGAP
jgi:hypothetical protein